MTNTNDQNQQKVIKIPRTVTFTMILMLMALLAVLLYVTLQRYSYLGESVKQGNIATTALLLSPEISTGLANIIGIL